MPADTAALLAAYIQARPGAAAQAAEIAETLALAKHVMARQGLPSIPPPAYNHPLRNLERVPTPGRRVGRWAYGMAACFAAGMFAGRMFLHSQIQTLQPPMEAKGAVATARVHGQPLTVTEEQRFWSLSHLYPTNSADLGQTHGQLVWISPLKRPQIRPQL